MQNTAAIQEDLVFGLDIGTRSIVGVVGFQDRKGFHVVAMAQQEHETRAMLDGQIHDIYKVGDTIRKVKNDLERQLDRQLSDVCIAAAGRVLRTVNATAEYAFEEETRVTQEHIYSLNLLAVEKAHMQINRESDKIRFYCVGNTPVNYRLNGFDITNLEGHKADKISVELIATFLPEEVVDGLYEAVGYAGLKVASLTLEPIAAMNIAIPEQYRLLNIGLIDVGAGTSDICLTKDGSIIAYGMIPFAGDEITEIIAKTYLVDFNTADKIKKLASDNAEDTVTFADIMGLEQTIPSADIIKTANQVVDTMAKDTADKIIELNGGKPVSAVFVVGGGGKIAGYTQKVAEYLGIQKERVAVRGPEVLTTVEFMVDNFKKDSLYVTPVGICTNYYTQKNNFIFVNVNNERVKLYDNDKLTIVDAVMQVGFPNEKLFPRRGKELNFTVNGKMRLVRGQAGEGAVVQLNGRQTNLNARIEQNDIITVQESGVGEPAHMTIEQLEEFQATIEFIVNGKRVPCPKFAYVNGELKSGFYDIQDGDQIQMENFYTVAQLFEFMDYDITGYDVYVNNELADKDTKVYENFSVKTSAITEHAGYEEISEENDGYDTEEQTEDIADTAGNSQADDDTPLSGENAGTQTGSADTAAQEVQGMSSQAVRNITILINGQPVRLTGKKDYILVDLFQYYEFDLSKPKGNIVLKLNGQEGIYTAPLHDGDVVDLYWEQ